MKRSTMRKLEPCFRTEFADVSSFYDMSIGELEECRDLLAAAHKRQLTVPSALAWIERLIAARRPSEFRRLKEIRKSREMMEAIFALGRQRAAAPVSATRS